MNKEGLDATLAALQTSRGRWNVSPNSVDGEDVQFVELFGDDKVEVILNALGRAGLMEVQGHAIESQPRLPLFRVVSTGYFSPTGIGPDFSAIVLEDLHYKTFN